jgi:hypothetical protein
MAATIYRSFAEFYPYYFSEHTNRTCRRLHFVGTTLGLLCLISALLWGRPSLVLLGLVLGYAFAWVGHYFFERNRPATFTYPLFSFMGDWVMWKDMLTGKIRF